MAPLFAKSLFSKKPSAHASSSKIPDLGAPRPAHVSVSGKTLGGEGRGKGAKGMGKGKTIHRRHRKVLKDNIRCITKADVRRLARRGGVKRISGMIYEETRPVIVAYLEMILRDCVAITEHCNRKTVTVADVVFALKRQGRTIYGFDDSSAYPHSYKKSKNFSE
ncbi:putative histone H4 [Amylocarpus encephaloides]|uniref:Histone H4 n=1 Tax=Amylocarpus encephaloides TaxID=45428 RepID=A0A9P8CA44_9HELO|nr:putative histone H4 [Amylocarpus encephaloides]